MQIIWDCLLLSAAGDGPNGIWIAHSISSQYSYIKLDWHVLPLHRIRMEASAAHTTSSKTLTWRVVCPFPIPWTYNSLIVYHFDTQNPTILVFPLWPDQVPISWIYFSKTLRVLTCSIARHSSSTYAKKLAKTMLLWSRVDWPLFWLGALNSHTHFGSYGGGTV